MKIKNILLVIVSVAVLVVGFSFITSRVQRERINVSNKKYNEYESIVSKNNETEEEPTIESAEPPTEMSVEETEETAQDTEPLDTNPVQEGLTVTDIPEGLVILRDDSGFQEFVDSDGPSGWVMRQYVETAEHYGLTFTPYIDYIVYEDEPTGDYRVIIGDKMYIMKPVPEIETKDYSEYL